MENFSRIYSSIEETCEELDNAIIGNPLRPRTTFESITVKDEMIKTGMVLLECKIRLWLLDKLLDGKITDREFLDRLEEELKKLHNL
jgi:hypothetical protein